MNVINQLKKIPTFFKRKFNFKDDVLFHQLSHPESSAFVFTDEGVRSLIVNDTYIDKGIIVF